MICANPACIHAGIDQPPENFRQGRHQCKDCHRQMCKDWRKRNADSQREYRKWIADDDPEDDLKPTIDGGWSVISPARNAAIIAQDTEREGPLT